MLAACGGSGTKPGSPQQPSTVAGVQVSSTSCPTSSSRATGTVLHPCVFVLTDGRRFSCPEAFARAPQTAGRLEHAVACKRLRPLAIPAVWRPVFADIQKTRACLTRHGEQVIGGPSLGNGNGPTGPIGELNLPQTGHRLPTLIGYYPSGAAARRVEPGLLPRLRRLGAVAERRGWAIIVWLHQPTRQERRSLEACVFGV